MNKFVKKLSFVLAAALVLTSVALPVSAKAATSGEVTARYLKSDKSTAAAVTSKTIYAGGKRVNFDYNYGGKVSGVKGVWSSSNPTVVSVERETGIAQAFKKGDVTLTFTPASSKYDRLSITVKSRVRATDIILHDGTDKSAPVVKDIKLAPNTTHTYYVELKTKTGTKSSYFVHASQAASDAAIVTNGTESGNWAGTNYGRTITVKTTDKIGYNAFKLTATPSKDPAKTSNYDVSASFSVQTVSDKFASAGTVVQAGVSKIKVSGVPSGASLIVNNDGSVIEKDEVVADRGNGTYDHVLTLRDALNPHELYVVYTKNEDNTTKVFGQVRAEEQRATSIKLKSVTVARNTKFAQRAVGHIDLFNQWNETMQDPDVKWVISTGSNNQKATTDARWDVNDYTFYAGEYKVGDVIQIKANAAEGRWDAKDERVLVVTTGEVSSYKLVEDGFVKNFSLDGYPTLHMFNVAGYYGSSLTNKLVTGDTYYYAFHINKGNKTYIKAEDLSHFRAFMTGLNNDRSTDIIEEHFATPDGIKYIYFVPVNNVNAKVATSKVTKDQYELNVTYTTTDGSANEILNKLYTVDKLPVSIPQHAIENGKVRLDVKFPNEFKAGVSARSGKTVSALVVGNLDKVTEVEINASWDYTDTTGETKPGVDRKTANLKDNGDGFKVGSVTFTIAARSHTYTEKVYVRYEKETGLIYVNADDQDIAIQ